MQRRRESVPLHAQTAVEQERGGQGYVTAFEGDDLLALAFIQNAKVSLGKIQHALAKPAYRDVELLQPEVDDLVDLQRWCHHCRGLELPVHAAHQHLELMFRVLLTDIHRDPERWSVEQRDLTTVDRQSDRCDLFLRRRSDEHLDLPKDELGGSGPLDPHLQRDSLRSQQHHGEGGEDRQSLHCSPPAGASTPSLSARAGSPRAASRLSRSRISCISDGSQTS